MGQNRSDALEKPTPSVVRDGAVASLPAACGARRPPPGSAHPVGSGPRPPHAAVCGDSTSLGVPGGVGASAGLFPRRGESLRTPLPRPLRGGGFQFPGGTGTRRDRGDARQSFSDPPTGGAGPRGGTGPAAAGATRRAAARSQPVPGAASAGPRCSVPSLPAADSPGLVTPRAWSPGKPVPYGGRRLALAAGQLQGAPWPRRRPAAPPAPPWPGRGLEPLTSCPSGACRCRWRAWRPAAGGPRAAGERVSRQTLPHGRVPRWVLSSSAQGRWAEW